jgi:hypothetical protein
MSPAVAIKRAALYQQLLVENFIQHLIVYLPDVKQDCKLEAISIYSNTG